MRNQVNIALTKAESKYWKDLLESKGKGSRDFWKIVKKMTGKERHDKRMGPLRDSDNNLILDDSKKAETLNDFFSTTGEKLASNFETYTHDNSPSDILAMNKGEIINNVTISEEKFEEKFKKLNIRKSHGADEITAREMKIVGDEVSYGFAGQWKTGKVKTIFKKGKKDLCDNYRPLTMLSIPSKITEGVFCETLDKHLEKTIQKNQWGFRKGLSTESLLLYLTETWKHYIEKGKVIGAIFIDFKKAFDSVDHKVLENKLRACGIEGNMLKFLKSYLSKHSQFVEVNGKRSKLLIIECGVPQGSLLGPRLYSIF